MMATIVKTDNLKTIEHVRFENIFNEQSQKIENIADILKHTKNLQKRENRWRKYYKKLLLLNDIIL